MAAVAFGCALAFLLLESSGNAPDGQRLATAHLRDDSARLSVMGAYHALRDVNVSSAEISTNRSEAPFWILTEPLRSPSGKSGGAVISLPSRHLQTVQYWLVDEQGRAIDEGHRTRDEEGTQSITRDKAGFAIALPPEVENVRLILRAQSSGPGRISAHVTTSQDLRVANYHFDRSGGLLFGSLLMIAAFSALVSLLSREPTFFLYSAWVVASLRLASYSAGWDLNWIGLGSFERYAELTKNVPLAAYAVLTVALFWAIFKREIVSLGVTRWIRALLVVSFCLALIAPFTPHRMFLPILWLGVFPSIVALLYLCMRIFLRTGSAAAAWYGASWIFALAGLLGDLAYATGISQTKPTLFSSLTSAVAAALLAGVALALRLKSEREARLRAQYDKYDVLAKFKQNYDSMPVGLFSMSSSGAVTLFNPAFATMFGVQGAQLRSDSSLPMSSLLGEQAVSDLLAVTGSADPVDFEFNVESDGQRRWFQARASAKGGNVEGSIQDVTARKAAESRLRHLVDHDSLTGMLNRHGLEEAMKSAAEAARRGLPCAIAHVDLDRFKLINDLYGHATGDAMIKEASKRLLATVRARDFVARIADSFVILLLDCPDRAVARLTERLRESIGEHPFDVGGKTLSMTVSVGVTALDPDMPPVEAMAAADRACAEAKSRGRNCVVRLDEGDEALKRHLEELRVVADMKARLPLDRYFLEMQPIVSLRSSLASLNYEVLIRMHGENGTVLPPARFIGAAERNGLMSQIDRWVIKTTLEWLDAHPAHRERLSFSTINISGSSLNDARFIEDAVAMLREHPATVNKICFEITESVALHDLDSTRRFVDRLRSFGSKLALDDFGAGYTSFNYLKEIPADFIKIDGTFVKDINVNPANYAITRTIVDLAHELGMRSIAEWAETPDTVASLIELRVDYGQGYGLARPMHTDLLAGALSSGALVRDPQVLTMLDSSASGLIAASQVGARRH